LAGDAVLDNETVLARHIESVVREHAASMLGIQETQNLVHLVQREMPELAAEVMRLVPCNESPRFWSGCCWRTFRFAICAVFSKV
jgi:flagellar biosynthesis component FlhA